MQRATETLMESKVTFMQLHGLMIYVVPIYDTVIHFQVAVTNLRPCRQTMQLT